MLLLDALALPLREGIDPHVGSHIHDSLSDLFSAEPSKDHFDWSSDISSLVDSGLVGDRAGSAPQLVRCEERLKLLIGPVESGANHLHRSELTMLHEKSFQRLELPLQGFISHGYTQRWKSGAVEGRRLQ